jgi:hypothetical protein
VVRFGGPWQHFPESNEYVGRQKAASERLLVSLQRDPVTATEFSPVGQLRELAPIKLFFVFPVAFFPPFPIS